MTPITKLNKYSILEVKGPDAKTFLQGQISQDLDTLISNTGKWFGLSNAKGRLLAVGQIYLAAEDVYWLALPKTIVDNIQPYLLRFKFRSKLEFESRDDLHVYGVWSSDIEFEHQIKLLETSDCRIVITSNEIETTAIENDWTVQKILNGLPDVFPDTQESFVAQMLNLDLIDGISFNKGCYTGQEIIARMQHLGRIKRRMLALELDEKLPIGDKWEIDGQKLGEIVNIVKLNDKFLALVCVQLDKLNAISIKPIELPYSINELG